MDGSQDGARVADVKRLGFIGLAVTVLAVSLLMSLGAVRANAVVAKVGGHGYGITPVDGAGEASLLAAYRASHAGARRAAARPFDGAPFGGTELENVEGGPVMHSTDTHVIFWDPTNQFSSTTKGIVEKFFGDVAHDSGLPSNVFAVAGQYTDASGHAAYDSTFAGALPDSHAYPSSGNCTVPNEVDKGPYATCLLDSQLQSELSAFIAEKGLPKGPTQLYFLLLPHTVATCFDETPKEEIEFGKICSNNFFCAYHSFISPGTAGEIIYADIPFSLLDSSFAKGCQDDGHKANIQQPNPDSAGGKDSETRFADVALKYISHEAIEAITDPLVNFDTAWVDEEGLEVGDKCNGVMPDFEEDGVGYDPNAFLPVLGGTIAGDDLFNQSINTGSYYLQSQWDNAGRACLMKPVALSGITLAIPAAVAGSPAKFSAGANDPYGDFQPTWSFGDGGTAVGPAPSHTYAAAGEYTLTMTPKDGLTGSTAPVAGGTVTVAPAPAGTVPTATASAASSTTAPAPAPAPAPDSAFIARTGTPVPATGAISFSESVADPGTFSWLATFANGRFGAFASSRCKAGFVKLAGKCRRAKIVFASGSRSVAAAGAVSFTLKPSASAQRALKNALRKGKGVPVSVALTFRSSRGGPAVTHVLTIVVKLKK
jgi:hypothetical protein